MSETNPSTPSSLLGAFFTEAQLIADLQISARTLRRWKLRGEGPPRTKLGRRVLYARQSVAQWIANLAEGAQRRTTRPVRQVRRQRGA